MSDIIYADVAFASGSCKVCTSCCFMRVEKNPHDAIPLEIDWSAVQGSRIEPMDLIKKVEYAATDSAGCPLAPKCDDEPVFGATHTGTRPAKIGRRSAYGPFTTARIWGGVDRHAYKLHMLVTYERCGHCYSQTFCIDVISNEC